MKKTDRKARNQAVQIERIRRGEELLDEISAALNDLQKAERRLDALRPQIAELSAYYGGPLWKKDFADDEAGLLPRDLKRGVLSEDAVYDLLETLREAGFDDSSAEPPAPQSARRREN